MTRCRIPEFCEIFEIDSEIYDPKGKRTLPRNVKQRDICVHIHKNHFCVIWNKSRRDSLLNGVEEIDKNFNFVKNTINENNLKERIRYSIPKHETIDLIVFVNNRKRIRI